MKKYLLPIFNIRAFLFIAGVSALIMAAPFMTTGQNVGDYRSIATGNWIDYTTTWEKYYDDGINGLDWNTPDAYPGQTGFTTGAVTIQGTHTVTVGSVGITTAPMGTLTIEPNAQLYLTGTNGNNFAQHSLNTMELVATSGSPPGTIYMTPKSQLILPENAILVVGAGAFPLASGDCNNNVQIWIGGVQFASCQGANGVTYSFDQLIAAGGTLNAIITVNPPVCDGRTISLTGGFTGAFGTTVPSGGSGTEGVNYDWTIIDPDGIETIPHPTTSSISIDNAIYDPVNPYSISLTVSTYLSSAFFDNTEMATVDVSPVPDPVITGEAIVSSNEAGVVYTTESGMFNYQWSVTGGTITAGGGTSDNTATVQWSSAGDGYVYVNYENAGGCDASTPTEYYVEIRDKVTVKDDFWNDGTTWDPPGVPTDIQDITILHTVNVANSASCSNMNIETGGKVLVNPGKSLTVKGTLTNSVGASALVIQSDATGTGSLIHNSDAVEATVRQYLTANAWHYVSSPISNATANVFYGMYLKSFDESTYAWNEYIVDPVTPLTNMLGYALWKYGGNATASFIGPMNNGNFTTSVTATPSASMVGWNLVGNPYPSPIDWDASTGWVKTNVNNTIYFWEGVGGEGAGNYHYYQGSGGELPGTGVNDGTNIIPAMQGFFVHASSNGTLEVNNDARVHDNQPYWKSSEAVDITQIRLEATSGETGYSDETILRFYPGATAGYDGQYDAFKLEGYLVPQIWSIADGQSNLAINTLPAYSKGTVIPLGFTSPGENSKYTISLTESENLETEFSIYLEDLYLNVMKELMLDDNYQFTSSEMNEPNRFMLHFVYKHMELDAPALKSSPIYSYDKSVYVQLDDAPRTNIAIFNLMGQKVAEYSTTDQGIFKIDLDCEPGYYVVRAQSGTNVSSEKVFIK